MDQTSATTTKSVPRGAHNAPAKPDRKKAILLAAEKLFAKRGYHAVSIRQIADEADVPLALVGYYYGQKQELFQAIFEHWNHTIEARLEALHRVNPGLPPAERLSFIVEAFVGPVLVLRASPEGEYYALLVARELYHAQEESDRVMRTYFDPLANAFIDALNLTFPHATRGEIAWCYQFALGALLHHLSDDRVERLSQGENRAGDAHAGPMLVRFITGGIQATLHPPSRTNAG